MLWNGNGMRIAECCNISVCATLKLSCQYVLCLLTALTTKSSAKSKENLYDNIAHEYIRCMNDMSGRGPGM